MDIEKLIERLRTESLYKDKATLEIMDLCMDAATALSTLQIENQALRNAANSFKAENEKLRAELEQKEKYYEQMVDALAATESAELEQVKRERRIIPKGYALVKLKLLEELDNFRELGPIDRLRELAQADREGRCVVLPFKPPRWVYVCSTRFPKPAQAHYASAINVLRDMDKGCVFGDTQEEAAAALRREQE